MEKQNALQQLIVNPANTSVGSGPDSSSLKNRKKEKLTENLTDFIECKSIMIANLDSCHIFAMPKKGIVRLTRDQAKRAFFLELYIQKDKDNKRVINIELDRFLNKPKADSNKIDLKIQNENNSMVKLEFDTNEKFNLINQTLNSIRENSDFMCPLNTKLEPSTVKLPRNEELLKRTPTGPSESKRPCLNQLNANIANNPANNTPTRPKPLVVDPRARQGLIEGYSALPGPQSPIVNQNSLSTQINGLNKNVFYKAQKTSQVLEKLFEQRESNPIVNQERQANDFCSSPISVKRKRDQDHDNLSNKAQQTKQSNMHFMNISKAFEKKKTTNENSSNFEVYDMENQENLEKSPVKTWNRNNSMNNKQCNKGFSNLGNTCYMNAILQCLLNIRLFSDELLGCYLLMKKREKNLRNRLASTDSTTLKQSFDMDLLKLEESDTSELDASLLSEMNGEKKEDEQQDSSLYKCMCALLRAREQHYESHQIHLLKDIKNAISKEATRFSGYQQHDAHEFLCQVLDQLKDDIDKKNKEETDSAHKYMLKELYSSTSSFSTTITNTAAASTIKQQQQQQQHQELDEQELTMNPVVDNFQFQVKHTVHCQKCKKDIDKFEEYNNLCLEMPPTSSVNTTTEAGANNHSNLSLQDTLDIFFRDEHIDDFKCETCESIQKVTIRRKFAKLPRILILHLKRYQFQEISESSSEQSAATFKMIKNDSHIQIPNYITLSSLVSAETLPFKPLNATFKFKAKSPPLPQKFERKQLPLQQKLRSVLGEKNINANLNPSYKIPKLIKPKLTNPNTDSDDALPDIKFDDPFKDFKMNNMTEQEQYELALKLSKTNQLDSVSLPNEISLMKFSQVDGNIDYTDAVFEEDDPIEDPDWLKNQIEHKRKPKQLFKYTEKTDEKSLQEHSKPIKTNKSAAVVTTRQQRSSRDTRKNSANSNTDISQEKDIYNEFSDDEEKMLKKALAESIKLAEKEKELEEKLIADALIKIEKNNEFRIDEPFTSDSFVNSEPSTITKNVAASLSNKKMKPLKDDQANTYRIIGIVNHLGVSSNSGHYISDVCNKNTNNWSSYDDTKVETLTQEQVLHKRTNTGYIFFYINTIFAQLTTQISSTVFLNRQSDECEKQYS